MNYFPILLAILCVVLVGCKEEKHIEKEVQQEAEESTRGIENSHALHFGPSPGDG